DLPHAGLTNLRADVDDHEPGQALAVRTGPGQGIDAAERHADEDEAIEPEAIDEGFDVGGVTLDAVIHLRRPLAVAVAPLIEGQAVPIGSERGADEVPGAGAEPAAVEVQQLPPAAAAPVAV